MKALVLSSSPRRNGNSARLAEAVTEGLAEAGHEAEFVFADDFLHAFLRLVGTVQDDGGKNEGRNDGEQDQPDQVEDDRMTHAGAPVRHSLAGRGCRYPFLRAQDRHPISLPLRRVPKRVANLRIRFPRFSGICPRWNIFAAFLTPGMIRIAISRMPDGLTYFCLARTIHKDSGGYHAQHPVQAIGLGCQAQFAKQLVYSDGVDLDNLESATPVGVTMEGVPFSVMPMKATRLPP